MSAWRLGELALARLEDLAKNDIVDFARVQPISFDQLPDHKRSQVNGCVFFQCAAELSPRSPGGIDEVDAFHPKRAYTSGRGKKKEKRGKNKLVTVWVNTSPP